MFYLTYAPGPPISEFVDYFWLFEGGQARIRGPFRNFIITAEARV